MFRPICRLFGCKYGRANACCTRCGEHVSSDNYIYHEFVTDLVRWPLSTIAAWLPRRCHCCRRLFWPKGSHDPHCSAACDEKCQTYPFF